jgi:hypothetical protein
VGFILFISRPSSLSSPSQQLFFPPFSLQDQDGASAWTPLDQPQYVGRSLLRPVDSSAYEIGSTFDLFKKLVLSQDGFDEIKKGDRAVMILFGKVN